MTDTIKASQQLIKEANMNMVFRLIHKNKRISRADIKKITKLSPATVSSLVEELMENGYVEECGKKISKSSGRNAIMLKVKEDGGFFLGLDVRKNVIALDLYSLDFSLKESLECPTKKGQPIFDGVVNAIEKLCKDKKILGATIGIPGVIDSKTNSLVSSTVISVEDAKDIYEILKNALPEVNVFMKNNSGLIALAEKEFGNHGETNNLISIDIDEGVGAGILIDGKIYDGSGMAGEFGHISVDLCGKRCKCGSYGCLELFASVPEILNTTKTDSLKELRAKLDKGLLKEELSVPARALAFGINNITNLLDPELIVIGGSVKILGNSFIELVRESYREISLIKNKKIVFSEIKENPVTLGGARVSFDEMFGL